MCGISAIFAKDVFLAKTLAKMSTKIRHRGPDDEGFLLVNQVGSICKAFGEVKHRKSDVQLLYTPDVDIESIVNDKFKFGLGHRRLSIIDLSPAGHMPMCLNDESLWIAYNGEVFNYLEIQEELISLGYQFNTKSDTEVILQAYKHWGTVCFDKFNGMWSIIIVDIVSGDVVCSRDRYGIKPIYYSHDKSGNLYFGSEIKQFSETASWTGTINQARCLDYLVYAVTDHSYETMFEGVFQIKPGHYIKFDYNNIPKSVKQVPWYNIPTNYNRKEFEESKNIFGQLFDKSIRLRLRSDVEVGSALSGGLDSSCIVSKVREILTEEDKNHVQKTFTAVHDDSRYNEEKWAMEVTKATTIDASYIKTSIEQLVSNIDKVLYHQDEPFQSQSIINSYFVFDEAARKNIKVLLNGQGADEFLGGYGHFRYVHLIDLLKTFRFVELTKLINHYRSEGESLKNIVRSMSYFFAPRSWIRRLSERNTNDIKSLLNLKNWKVLDSHPNDAIELQPNSTQEQINYFLFHSPLQKYLHWEDRNSMAHSIEARVPFLDHELIEFSTSCDPILLAKGNNRKILLKESQRGITPDTIIDRKDKIGYKTAEEMWVKDTHSDIFRELMKNSIESSKGMLKEDALDFLETVIKGDRRFDYTYWRIILFGRWIKLFDLKLE